MARLRLTPGAPPMEASKYLSSIELRPITIHAGEELPGYELRLSWTPIQEHQ
jgi:hypothetical protein